MQGGDRKGYAPSSILPTSEFVISNDSVHDGNISISYFNNPRQSGFRPLCWRLVVGNRDFGRLLGDTLFYVDGKNMVKNRKILKDRVYAVYKNKTLNREAKISIGDGKVFDYKSSLKMTGGKIKYTIDIVSPEEVGMTRICLGMNGKLFKTENYMSKNGTEKTFKVIRKGRGARRINPGEKFGLISKTGDKILWISSPLAGSQFVIMEGKHRGGNTIIYDCTDNNVHAEIEFDVSAFKNVTSKKLTVPQKVLNELNFRGENLLRNGDFELGEKDFKYGGWQYWGWANPGNSSLDFSQEKLWMLDKENPYSGKWCMKAECPPGFTINYVRFHSVPLKKGGKYTVSFYAKSPAKSSFTLLAFGGDEKNQSDFQSYSHKIFRLTDQWKRYTFTFTAKLYYCTIELRMDNRYKNGKTKICYFDGIMLNKGNKAGNFDRHYFEAGIVSENLSSVYSPDKELELKQIVKGKPGEKVELKTTISKLDGRKIFKNNNVVVIGKGGITEKVINVGKPGKGFYVASLEAQNKTEKRYDYYRIYVIPQLPGNLKNKYLFSLGQMNENKAGWKDYLSAVERLGVHLGRTASYIPEVIMEKYIDRKNPQFEFYSSCLTPYSGYGRRGTMNPDLNKFPNPFKLTSQRKKITQEIATENFKKYSSINKFFFVLNEPNAPWKLNDGSGKTAVPPPGNVAEMTRWVWEVKNKISPSSKLAGPSTFNVDPIWIDRYLAAGAAKYIDILDCHEYSWHPEMYMDVKIARLRKEILKKYGLENIKLMCSEMGLYHPRHLPELNLDSTKFSHGFGTTFFDYRIDIAEKYLAQLVVRYLLLGLKNDFLTISYYAGDYDTDPFFDANLVPLMYLPVFTVFNSYLGNMKYHSEINFDDNTRCLIFTGKDIDGKDSSCAVLWCSLKEVGWQHLPRPSVKLPAEKLKKIKLELAEYDGSETELTQDAILPVGAPVYLKAKYGNGRSLTADDLHEFIFSASLLNYHGNLIKSSIDFGLDAIKVFQSSRKKQKGLVSLLTNKEFPFKYKAIKWNNSTSIQHNFKPFNMTELLPFKEYKFILNDELANLKSSTTYNKNFYCCNYYKNNVPFTTLSAIKYFGKKSKVDKKDLSAEIKVLWDDIDGGGINFEIKVNDDVFFPLPRGKSLKEAWMYDSISVYFDTRADGGNCKLKVPFDSNDYKYEISLAGKGGVFRSVNPVWQECFLHPQRVDSEVKVKIEKAPGTYKVKIRFPATRVLPFKFAPGKKFRFAVFITDNDGKGRECGIKTNPTAEDPYYRIDLWTESILLPENK